jgi:Tfp pilus assembly protein PilF
MLRQVAKAFADKEPATEEEIQAAIDHVMMELDAQSFAPETPEEQAYEEYDIACGILEDDEPDAEKQARKHLKKALKLDPDCLDAQLLLAEMDLDTLALVGKLEGLEPQAERTFLKRADHTKEEAMGIGWGIIELRPYLRLKQQLAENYLKLGMYSRARAKYEELLQWTDNDNQGCRFILIGIYAFFEDQAAAMRLYEHYSKDKSAWTLLSLATLSYKFGDQRKAKAFIRKLLKNIPEAAEALALMLTGDAEDTESLGYYHPGSADEFMLAFRELSFLFLATPGFVAFFIETAMDIEEADTAAKIVKITAAKRQPKQAAKKATAKSQPKKKK